jgi:hypothetical protein
MEDKDEKDFASAILGIATGLAILLSCICGALECFGIHTAPFSVIVVIWIPSVILALIIEAIYEIANNEQLSSLSILIITLVFFYIPLVVTIIKALYFK